MAFKPPPGEKIKVYGSDGLKEYEYKLPEEREADALRAQNARIAAERKRQSEEREAALARQSDPNVNQQQESLERRLRSGEKIPKDRLRMLREMADNRQREIDERQELEAAIAATNSDEAVVLCRSIATNDVRLAEISGQPEIVEAAKVAYEHAHVELGVDVEAAKARSAEILRLLSNHWDRQKLNRERELYRQEAETAKAEIAQLEVQKAKAGIVDEALE